MSPWVKRLFWLFAAIRDFLIPSRRRNRQLPAPNPEAPDRSDVEDATVASNLPGTAARVVDERQAIERLLLQKPL